MRTTGGEQQMQIICSGDKVLMKQPYHNKFTTPFQTKPYTVKSKTGNCTTVESPEGILYKRNVRHLKKYRTRSEASESTHEKEETTVEDMSENRDQQTMEESPVEILEPNNTAPNNTDEPENSDKPNNTDEPENSVETEVAVDRPEQLLLMSIDDLSELDSYLQSLKIFG